MSITGVILGFTDEFKLDLDNVEGVLRPLIPSLDHMLRFSKRGASSDHMLRFSRDPADHMLRFSRSPAGAEDHMLRFSRSPEEHMLRFGR